jgi:hypothetical protein
LAYSLSLGGSVLDFDSYCAVVRTDTDEVVSTGITPMAAVVEARQFFRARRSSVSPAHAENVSNRNPANRGGILKVAY